MEKLNKKYLFLKQIFCKIIKHNPSYGYRRISKALSSTYNLKINHKLIRKLLKLWGLELKRSIRKRKRKWIDVILQYLQSRANLVKKMILNNKLNSCFQVIVSDITEIHYKSKKAYLCVHMDYIGKMIYGWYLSKSPDASLIKKSFNKAVEKIKSYNRSIKQIVFHQDRGSVYTGNEYMSAVLKNDGYLSYSRKGEPGDNAVNESFFSRFKEENADIFLEAKDFDKLYRLINRQIKYYNQKRFHSSIGYNTPFDFTKLFLSNLT